MSCSANLHTTRTAFGWGEEPLTLSSSPCPSSMSAPIHPKHCPDFLILPAREVQGKQPWEARRRNEGCSFPGFSAVGHIQSVLHHQFKLYSLTQSQDLWLPTVVPMATAATATTVVLAPTATSEWCLTKGSVETLCCIPPQLLASSGKPY